ncbi:hypothetical protein B0H14DRAFT_1615954 [Mycena olivaceomarginata]|nr:hypothetical protein B0H14DRAFT_1615954 [Mycena olivaceomarginata]
MMLVSQHVCSFIGYIPSIQSPNPVPWFAMPWAFHPFDCASPPLPFLLPSSFIHPSLISLPPDALRSGLHCAHCDPRRCLSSGLPLGGLAKDQFTRKLIRRAARRVDYVATRATSFLFATIYAPKSVKPVESAMMFLGGLSIHLSTAVLAHLFSYGI